MGRSIEGSCIQQRVCCQRERVQIDSNRSKDGLTQIDGGPTASKKSFCTVPVTISAALKDAGGIPETSVYEILH